MLGDDEEMALIDVRAEKLADEPLDVWLKPCERARDPKNAMNEYLSWEVDLLEHIKQDGTTHFIGSA